MKIVEIIYHPKIELADATPTGLRKAMRAYRGCITKKTLGPGDHEIKDLRWTLASSLWKVHVNKSGDSGTLRIISVSPIGYIKDIKRNEKIADVVKNIDTHGITLAGQDLIAEDSLQTKVFIFKGLQRE